MKKLNYFLIVLAFAICGAFIGGNLLNTKTARAEDLSNSAEYFYVQKEAKDAGDNYVAENNAPEFKDGDAFLLNSNERVSVVLGDDARGNGIKYSEKLLHITYKITINNSIAFNDPQNSSLTKYGIEVPSINANNKAFHMTINPEVANNAGGEFIYGKYTIEFSYYYEDENLESQYMTLSCNMYILDYSDYKSSFSYENLTQNGTYYSNYYNAQELSYVSYSYKNYNAKIVKVFKGITTTTTLTYNGSIGVATIDQVGTVLKDHCVTIYQDSEKVYLTFNNLGIYYLTFEPINPNGSNEVITQIYGDTLNVDSQVTIYGYQAYYTDQDGLKEFKLPNDKNATIENDSESKRPWIISGTKYSADVTYLASGDALNLLSVDSSNIAKTNQAPIYFDTNATLKTDASGKYESKYYYFKNETVFDGASVLPTATSVDSYVCENYSAEPLSITGIYLVKIVYTYSAYSTDSQTQYFLFRITNDSPKVEIYTIDNSLGTESKTFINNDEYTYRDVYITKSTLDVFDSKSTLLVYKDTQFNGKYDSGIEVTEGQLAVFDTTAKYKVELKYGSNNKKGFTTYFVIDKEAISEISFKNLINTIGSDYRVGETLSAPYVTSNAVALSWKPKTSGATVVAEYKYFPTSYSLSNVAELTSAWLETVYNSNQAKFSIPSTHVLTCSGNDLPVDEYSNTYGKNIILQSEALSAGGLYIFKIYDSTGAQEQYFALFIDSTPNTIISVSDGNYNIATYDEVTTENKTLYFGKNKLIKINAPSGKDAWLENYLNGISQLTLANKDYLMIDINPVVYYSVNTSNHLSKTLNEAERYGITLEADLNNDEQYTFYTICASTNKTSDYEKNSFEYYKENYTATHTIRFTTDNSRINVFYNTSSQLQQLDPQSDANKKINYYAPACNNLFDILYVTYCVKPNDNLTVKSVEINYYPFVISEDKETYTFASTPITIPLYADGVLYAGRAVSGESNTYLYEINKEDYNTSSSRTKSGKYEIIRKYTDDSTLSAGDPIERQIVFIVDRNSLINEPIVDGEGNSKYYVGSGIQLHVAHNFGTEYYEDQKLHYYDLYYATKLSTTELVPVLKTNFVPVTVYIPTYKYGYIQNINGYPTFVREESIGEYSSGKFYENYELSAKVEHYGNSSLNSYITTYNFSQKIEQNFLTISGNTIHSFKDAGYYRVTINSVGGETFSFVFQIEYEEPEFEVLDATNTPMTSDSNGIYYTNKNIIRVSWQDSASAFLARIDQTNINYRVNGVTYYVEENNVKEDGNNQYHLDIDLGANYYHNAEVEITLQYTGSKSDSKYFSKTKRVIVDLEAPSINISKLIQQSGLTWYDLRTDVDGKKYNTSKTEGILRHFAFTIDASNFNSIILDEASTNYDYYKLYYKLFYKNGLNTKYVAGNANETDVTTDLAGQMDDVLGSTTGKDIYTILSESNYNKYIEIIEEDFAGNRTVYTIYLTNIADNQDEIAFEYTNLTNANAAQGSPTKNYTVKELNSFINLYSKRTFNLEKLNFIYNNNLGNLTWQIVTVGTSKFVKSPYSNGAYYKLNDSTNTTHSLQELSTLSENSNSQLITLHGVPVYQQIALNVYVLNETLEIYKLSEIMNGDEYEGILIKIPENKATENNIIYGVSLSMRANMSGNEQVFPTIGEEFLTGEIVDIPVYENMLISYVSYRGGRYLQVEFINNIALNDYFVYTIVDNFDEEYNIIHIYGQTDISEPIISDGYIAESYDEYGSIIYYSAEDIEYRYDTTIYKEVIVKISLNSNGVADETFNIKDGAVYKDGIIVNDEEYKQYFEITKYNNVLCVKMIHPNIDFAEGIYGGSRFFTLTLIAKEVFGLKDQTIKFNIYNQLPDTLKIISKESAVDVTSILGGTTAFAGEVVINYLNTKLDHEFELLLMMPDGSISILTDGTEISEDGTYKIIINYLGYITGCSKVFNFTIANSTKFIYSVVAKQEDGTFKNVKATGNAFTYQNASDTISIATHYIVNSEYDILLNSNLYLKKELVSSQINGYTFIYNITNLNTPEAESGLISEFYSNQIAISVIPKSSSLLKKLTPYGANVKEQDLLTLNNPSITPYVTTKEEYDDGVKISWSKYNLIPENKIIAEVYYGNIDGLKLDTIIDELSDNTLNSITLKTSGTYYVRFVDMAGNVQLFGQYKDNEYFTIKYLSSVIFEIQGETPINHSIYDEAVNIDIPDYTLAYYDVNSKPIINVELNGQPYTKYVKSEDGNSWLFEDYGMYKVWFTAKIDEKTIYEAPIFFTILSSKENRKSFTYSGYANYYIQDVLLDGQSVISKLANINSGDIYEINNSDYLKTIYLHANDIKTGNGNWTLIVNTNNEFNQTFKFTVKINKVSVPLQLSVANGGSTTDTITISFNSANMLREAGDCIIKISGYENLILTQEKLENNEINELYNLTISKSGNYYIEVTSLSGQLLYSAYVIKAEPLNTVSIIIIVVAVIVVAAAIILFVLLRKRMKIR